MLSFSLSNLSFYILENLSSRSSEIVCWRAACNGPPAQMVRMASKPAWTHLGVIEGVERRYRGCGTGNRV